MVIHGQKLTADSSVKTTEKYSTYEIQYNSFDQKLDNGESIKLKELKEPIVVLNFWASWCTPCLSEFKSLNQLISKYGSKVKVIGVNSDYEEPLKKVRKTKVEYNLKFSSVVDSTGELADNFSIKRIPASIVYHKGKVIDFSNKEFNFMSDDFLALIDSKVEKSNN